MRKDKGKDNRKKRLRRQFDLRHETPTGRRILNRTFRRRQRHLLRKEQALIEESDKILTVTSKDYRTRGWETK